MSPTRTRAERRPRSRDEMRVPREREPAPRPAGLRAGATTAEVLALQRTVGNAAVAAALGAHRRAVQRVAVTHEHTAEPPPALVEGATDVGRWLVEATARLEREPEGLQRTGVGELLRGADAPAVKRIVDALREQYVLTVVDHGPYRHPPEKSRDAEGDTKGYRYVDDPGSPDNASTEGMGPDALISFFPPTIEQAADKLRMTVLHELSHASPVLKTVDVASAYAGEEFFPFLGGFAESAANADTIAFVVGALLGQPTATERVSADRATREQRAGKLTGDDARFASLTAGLARVIALYARDIIEMAIVPYLEEVLQQKQWAVRHRGLLFYRGLSRAVGSPVPPGEGFRDDEGYRNTITATISLLNRTKQYLLRPRIILPDVTFSRAPGDFVATPDAGELKLGDRFFSEPQPEALLVALGQPDFEPEEMRLFNRIALHLAGDHGHLPTGVPR